MIEPISMSLAAALLYRSVEHEGLLGKVFEDLFGENATKVVERVLHSLRDALKAGTLPANRDLRRAGMDSLRKAGLVLADALVCELDPTLKRDSWVARFERRLTVAHLITVGAGPEMAWVQRLVTAVKDEATLKVLDDAVLQIGSDSTKLLQTNVDPTLAAKLHEAFGAWVEEHVEGNGKPQCFEHFLSAGWPVEQGNLTLYQAYCIFFREHLKHDQTVCNIFTGNALMEIKSELDKLSLCGSVDADEITNRLQSAFTQSLDQQLGSLHDTVKDWHTSFTLPGARQASQCGCFSKAASPSRARIGVGDNLQRVAVSINEGAALAKLAANFERIGERSPVSYVLSNFASHVIISKWKEKGWVIEEEGSLILTQLGSAFCNE